MSSLPPLAVLAAAPKSGLPRPRADYIDLTFNQMDCFCHGFGTRVFPVADYGFTLR